MSDHSVSVPEFFRVICLLRVYEGNNKGQRDVKLYLVPFHYSGPNNIRNQACRAFVCCHCLFKCCCVVQKCSAAWGVNQVTSGADLGFWMLAIVTGPSQPLKIGFHIKMFTQRHYRSQWGGGESSVCLQEWIQTVDRRQETSAKTAKTCDKAFGMRACI